jgi:hypothetical protein
MKKTSLNYYNLFGMFIICFGVGLLLGAYLSKQQAKKAIEIRYKQVHEKEEGFGGDESLEAMIYILEGKNLDTFGNEIID